MKKETITLDAIKKDFMIVVNEQMANKSDWRFSYIIPSTLTAILIGALMKSVWISLLIFLPAIYHIAVYVSERKKLKAGKAGVLALIERGDISISTEELSHIANETIYEPHVTYRHRHHTKEIKRYYFSGGSSWRVPNIETLYSWSKEFYLSPYGLSNISLDGDEFFFIRLKCDYDIAYIYPCKTFELDPSLRK